jgi:VWFA-related protein
MAHNLFRKALWLAVPFVLSAQEPAPIRVNVNEVVVPVTVTDAEGRFVSDLKQTDFEVYDQGVKQDIRFFSAERSQPVVVGFLMELSNGMRVRWKNYQETAVELALALLPGDRKYSGYLIGYGNQAEVLVNTTSDADAIVAKLNKVTPGGGAALYDAIWQACTNRKLVPGEPLEPRSVIVIVGDGHDNASTHTLEQVLEIAQRKLVTIYAISTDAYGYTADSGKVLRRLAEETGGRVEYPLDSTYDNVQGFLSRPSDLGNYEFKPGTGGYTAAILTSLFKSIQNISGEITTQYILRYVPNVPGYEGTRHELNVRVGIPNVVVKARTLYYQEIP